TGKRPLQKYVRIGIVPRAELFLELARLVHDDLAVVGLADGVALERARRRAFEVDAADLEPGAVTGALEFLLALQPVRRAAQVRTGRAQSIDDVAATLVLGANNPGADFLELVIDLILFVTARIP